MDATAEELIARLRRNPDDDAAFAALRAHYHRLGDYASLANLMEGWAGRARDAATGAQAFFETGELVLGTLRDRPRAIGLYERALERNPLLGDAASRLESLLEDAQDWKRLGEWLERRADALDAATADPRMRAAMRHRIGELWEQRFQRPDRAILHYRKAFELDPTLVAAIYAAREIYRAAGNLKAAATLYDLEANAEADGARKLALLRELAHLRAERLADIEGAIVALRRALGLVPGDLGVMHDLATVLLRRAERATEAQTASEDRFRASDLLFQMAQSVPPDAALGYLEAALDATPDHDGAVQMLERVAGQTGREDLLPIRWVAFLQAAPDAPGAMEMRRGLGHAYVEAGQLEDAIICFEPLLEAGDASAAETLIELYRQAGREGDVPRALTVAVQGLPPLKRVPRLREIVDILTARGDRVGAALRARDILAIDPADPEALAFLEDDCRSRNDYGGLRDLLLGAARVPGLSVEARKQRLREVALVSENKLHDVDGAISAWRAMATLDPADAEARTALKRLLERAERWDDLVQVFEREALSITDPDAKADVYKRLAKLHREKRRDLQACIQALQDLLDLRPGDHEARDDLCDGLLEVGRHTEALPMLRQRIESSSGAKRVDLLRTLAKTLEEHLGDDEGAFETSARLLDEDPGNLDALERMERIDMRGQRFARLLQTLSYRADVAAEGEKAIVLARMGTIAERDLGDLERAAEFYVRALDLAPEDADTLDALCNVYDRAERYKDLVVLLRARAAKTASDRDRAELYRRMARILGDRVRNEDGAAEAWQEVLRAGEDEEALRQLSALADKRDEPDTLEDLLRRLGEVVAADEERRDLLLRRAALLADRVDRKNDAVAVLRDVLSRLDPACQPALIKLALLCEELGDKAGLADALERQLALTTDDGLRVPLASRLADLYEQQLADAPHAIDACFAWAEADLDDPEPRRRLVRLLDKAERWPELIDALDSLAALEPDDDVVGTLVLHAADVAQRRLGDVDGAWVRLAPRVMLGDVRAETAMRELAKFSERGEALAELYVALAQQNAGSSEEAQRWGSASKVYEEFLGDPLRALEATLRAFATDLDDESFLDEADRLAALAHAWPRLGQVYETLVRRTEDPVMRVTLLVRHAERLADQGDDPSGGLDRMLRACSLAPQDDAVLERAEAMAARAGRSDEMLIVYDRRRGSAENDSRRVDSLLRAASLSDATLGDRERAMHYLAQAVALTVRSPELCEDVEATARELDNASATAGGDAQAAQRGLVGIYQALAEDAVDQPDSGGRLLLRAATILDTQLGDAGAAFDALKHATAIAPTLREALDELERFAEREHLLEDLDRHYAHLIDEALDSKTASELLRRRGALLEDELQRFSQAAEVYSQLLSVASGDPDAPRRLRACLRQAGRHQDLLMAIDRELEYTREAPRRAALLKEAAKTWETLRNKWEALDTWKKVLGLDPDDADALAGVARLEQAARAANADPFSDSDMADLRDDVGRPLADAFPEEPIDEDLSADRDEPAPRRGRRGPTKVVEAADISRPRDLDSPTFDEPDSVPDMRLPDVPPEDTFDSAEHSLDAAPAERHDEASEADHDSETAPETAPPKEPQPFGSLESALESSVGLPEESTTGPLDATAAADDPAPWDSDTEGPVAAVREPTTGEIDLEDVESVDPSVQQPLDSLAGSPAEPDVAARGEDEEIEELDDLEEVVDTGDVELPVGRPSSIPPPLPPRASQPSIRVAPPPPPPPPAPGTPSRPPPPPVPPPRRR